MLPFSIASAPFCFWVSNCMEFPSSDERSFSASSAAYFCSNSARRAFRFSISLDDCGDTGILELPVATVFFEATAAGAAPAADDSIDTRRAVRAEADEAEAVRAEPRFELAAALAFFTGFAANAPAPIDIANNAAMDMA
jgi:hypothetical protein